MELYTCSTAHAQIWDGKRNPNVRVHYSNVTDTLVASHGSLADGSHDNVSISRPISNSSPSVVGYFQPSKSGRHYPTKGSSVPGNLTFVKVNTGRRCMRSRSGNQGRCIRGLTSLTCVYTPNGTCNTPLVLFLDQGILQLCYEHPPCNTPLVLFLHQCILQLCYEHPPVVAWRID